MFRDKTLSLPRTHPSRQRLGVKPIPQVLPSRIRTPFTICSVKRTLQLASLPREAFAPVYLPCQASYIRATLLLLQWGRVCCKIPQADHLKAFHWEGQSHSTLDKNAAWQTALFLRSLAGIRGGVGGVAVKSHSSSGRSVSVCVSVPHDLQKGCTWHLFL